MKTTLSFFSAHPLETGVIALAVVILVFAVVRVLAAIAREKKAAAEARRLRAEQAEKSEKLSYFFTKK